MLRRIVAAVVVALVASGCSRPPREKQVEHCHELLTLHYYKLNNEAALARAEARFEVERASQPDTGPVLRLPDISPSVGRQYSMYTWDAAGYILRDIECPRCRTKHLVVLYRGTEVLCSSCGSRDRTGLKGDALVRGGMSGADLQQKYGERFKPMFEPVEGEGKDLVAIVRYVRRVHTLDDRARLDLSPKATEKQPVDAAATVGGVHRPDTTFVATTAFVYDGEIHQIDARSVAAILGGEADRKTWRYGGSTAIEEPVRPWTQPRTLDTPIMRPQ